MLVTVYDGDNFEMLVTDCSATNIENVVIKRSPTQRCHQATSKLETDDWDEMSWRQLWDVGDDFGRFCHRHPLSFNISVGHRHPKDVTNIEFLPTTPENAHQHKVTNIHLSPTSMWPCHHDDCSLFENIFESDEVFSGLFEVFSGFWNGCWVIAGSFSLRIGYFLTKNFVWLWKSTNQSSSDWLILFQTLFGTDDHVIVRYSESTIYSNHQILFNSRSKEACQKIMSCIKFWNISLLGKYGQPHLGTGCPTVGS